MTSQELLNYCFKPNFDVFVFKQDNEVLGSYIIGPITAGLAMLLMINFVVKGLKKMGLHSIETSKNKGFKVIQFLRVVSINQSANNSWKNLGFEIIATIPEDFRYKNLGYVDQPYFFKKL
jgi:hypothetical protein